MMETPKRSDPEAEADCPGTLTAARAGRWKGRQLPATGRGNLPRTACKGAN